ncbi:hypothetical protein BST81_07330 [Leptolyngbya sp. 'hensonii']|uniref:CHASE2 domain-containing protein n=1 Tax=Leptolyngbya sp. 'hensonii' TaxID=1922337 RepID=UPI00094FDE19|nr:CHASE2 domain-containing protein [Leptolyngbya sp. 'hensonii']OLP19025.1 hypothetical protein BST81_07330 [Leptolyngbya sp. 'hensonii']
MYAFPYQLEVNRVEQSCLFKLTWGEGQRLTAQMTYPIVLTTAYQIWQRTYLNFYQKELRGKAVESGSVTPPPTGWRSKLAEAEAKLLSEFHDWLNRGELIKIRGTLAESADREANAPLDLFLSCNSIDLARLPWEAWEIRTTSGMIRIARTAANITQDASPKVQRQNPRLLVILGDETGLNFEAEKQAIQDMKLKRGVTFLGWQPGQKRHDLMTAIRTAITDPQGWDGLFFIGHSNETDLTGGELAIAPGESILIQEIAPDLALARKQGLQFALFNSCSGLSIADALIGLGLSQVVVMREPIHNQVAQEFLAQVLQGLDDHQDLHTALLRACHHLKLGLNVTYPSAHLIPSLFRHPQATLFRIPCRGLWKTVKQSLPGRRSAIGLAALTLLSGNLGLQAELLNQRTGIQAAYRQVTRQIPTDPPPVLLVQIDADSIREAKISTPNPMDRRYLATLVDRLTALDARVLGIDYLLDRSHQDRDGAEGDRRLAQAFRTAAQRHPHRTWLVLPTVRNDMNPGWLSTLGEIAAPTWMLEGHINAATYYIPYSQGDAQSASYPQRLPFAYLLALTRQLQNRDHPLSLPQTEATLWEQLDRTLQKQGTPHSGFFPPQAQLHPITNFAYGIGQMWLNPIIDYSLPPDRIYTRVPAWQVLKNPAAIPQGDRIPAQVVLIVPYYDEAGVAGAGQDTLPQPAGVKYWLRTSQQTSFSGGQLHAYLVQHYLTGNLVVPIPDLWAIVVALFLGAGTVYGMRRFPNPQVWCWAIGGGTIGYGLLSLQFYISAHLLLPWLLPTAAFWAYTLPECLNRRSNRKPFFAMLQRVGKELADISGRSR